MMATQTPTTIPTAADPAARATGGTGLVPYRLTVRQFKKIIEAGVYRSEDRVELLGGLLVKTTTTYDPHDFAVSEPAERFRDLLEPTWANRQERCP